MMNIPISRTKFTVKELEIIKKPLETGWVVQGKYVEEFENKWCDFTGAKYSIATTSCTTGLHLCLAAFDIGFGDEVIIPSFTWIATANAIESLGAKAVFCDIDLNTFNINVTEAEKLINSKTKALIPVHLFGLAADMKPVLSLASKHNLKIIEDAACGFASKYEGTHVGNFGEAGCFSFHPRKALTTGEGGMVTVNNELLAGKLRSMRDHGASVSDLQRHLGSKPYLLSEYHYLGFNYRMTDIQAAIGSSQMDRASEIRDKRILIAKKYDEVLTQTGWLKKPIQNGKYSHGYQAYVCLFEPQKITLDNVSEINKQRNSFMDYLQQKGISTRPGTHAVHLQKYYAEKYNIKKEMYPNALIADYCSIAFPLFTDLSDEEFNYITQAIIQYKS